MNVRFNVGAKNYLPVRSDNFWANINSPLWFFFLIFILFFHSIAHARPLTQTEQQSTTLLVSCGVLGDLFFSTQDWDSFSVKEALKRKTEARLCPTEEITKHLKNLSTLTPQKKSQHGFDFVPLQQMTLNLDKISSAISVAPFNDRGETSGIFNSATANQKGRLYGPGIQLSWGASSYLDTKKIGLFLAPRFDAVTDAPGIGSTARLTADSALMELFFPRSVTLKIGRHPLVWGQGEFGGFIFSQNARAMDHALLTNSTPFSLPWIFKHAGKIKISLAAGTLGPDRIFPWEMFTGLSMALKPSRFFELQVVHALQFMGQGAPSLTPRVFIQDFFGFIPPVTQTGLRGTNKLSDINFRFMIPEMAGFETYFEYMMEDGDFGGGIIGLKKHFGHNSSYLGGFVFRCLPRCGDEFGVEILRTSPIAYRSGEFLSGWTLNGNFLGSWAGPDAKAISARYKKILKNFELTGRYIFIERESNVYRVRPDGHSVFIQADGIAERHHILSFEPVWNFSKKWSVSGKIGIEKILNYDFSATSDPWLFTASSAFTWRY